MKTAELTGAQLDYWAAKAEGKRLFRAPAFDVAGDRWQWTSEGGNKLHNLPVGKWHPSTDWSQAGPIIERDGITLLQPSFDGNTEWQAIVQARLRPDPDIDGVQADGPTPLIAAMRAYVASKFGDEVGEK